MPLWRRGGGMLAICSSVWREAGYSRPTALAGQHVLFVTKLSVRRAGESQIFEGPGMHYKLAVDPPMVLPAHEQAVESLCQRVCFMLHCLGCASGR